MRFQSRAEPGTRGRLLACVLAVLATGSSFATYARPAQKDNTDARSEAAIMQALLMEVRQLRQAVEHLSAVNGRMQITMQQMQLQEQRLNHASVQLEDVRRQIAGLSTRQAETASALHNVEARLSQEQDPGRLSQLEEEQASLKMAMERFAAQDAQLRAQEADAAILVQGEQNKWQDLSDQLSALIQSLGSDSTVPASRDQKVR